MPSTRSPAHSIPDTQLGLTPAEVQLLRQQQQLIARAQGQGQGRGRGASVSSQASNASSQGRLLLDPGSLTALAAHFDRLMEAIRGRWAQLHEQTLLATQAQYDRAGNAIQLADAEIARFHAILRQIDELQLEFDKVRRIGEIVKAMRARVEALDRRVR